MLTLHVHGYRTQGNRLTARQLHRSQWRGEVAVLLSPSSAASWEHRWGGGGAHQVPRGRILLSLEKFLRRSRFSKEDSDVCPFSKPRMVEIYASCSWISNLPKVECFSSGNGLLLSFKKWIIFLFWSQLSPSEKTPAFKRRKCRRTNFLLCLT